MPDETLLIDALTLLDNRLDYRVEPLNISIVGGMAMVLHRIYPRVTFDVDMVTSIDSIVNNIAREIAAELGLREGLFSLEEVFLMSLVSCIGHRRL